MSPALRPLLWLLVPLLLVLAPHALRLPVWISLAWLVFALIGLEAAHSGRQRVGGALKSLLVLAGAGGVLLQYGTVVGPAGGVALLAFLTGAKLLETNTPRDRLGLLFVGCFLLVAHFLDGQSLVTAGYMAFAALALVAGMIATQRPGAAVRSTLALAARLLAQALPLALLVFLLFPRLQGPLWGLPQQAAARSGLSDQMRPGDISQLILSDELALRADFDAEPPPSHLRYWRGPVFWDFDGRAWRTLTPPRGEPMQAGGIGQPLRHGVTLEPHGQRWLPLLGLPVRLPELPGNPSRLGADLQWHTKEAIDQRLRYEVESYPEYLLEPELPAARRARALALPANGNPRARDLARGWLEGAASDQAIVERALALFREEPFHYTLNPPRLGEESVDDFLFRTRRGFCEQIGRASCRERV